MYEIVEIGGSKTEPAIQVLKLENADGTTSWIPMDEANTDYQAYLAWAEENK